MIPSHSFWKSDYYFTELKGVGVDGVVGAVWGWNHVSLTLLLKIRLFLITEFKGGEVKRIVKGVSKESMILLWCCFWKSENMFTWLVICNRERGGGRGSWIRMRTGTMFPSHCFRKSDFFSSILQKYGILNGLGKKSDHSLADLRYLSILPPLSPLPFYLSLKSSTVANKIKRCRFGCWICISIYWAWAHAKFKFCLSHQVFSKIF